MKAARAIAFAMIVASLVIAPAGTSARQAATELYTCSMHPNVVDARAGECPVCSMTLKARAMKPAEAELVAFFKAYDAAFVGKNMDTLASMYAAETTVFEGGGINEGWRNYRDTHLGPELQSFEGLEFTHTNVVPHLIGPDSAYVTADYTIKARTGDRVTAGGGLATYLLSKDADGWKIRHTHTSAKRRAATEEHGGD